MSDVIRIEDAKAMKEMGMPLDTPVVQGETSPIVAKHWGELEKQVRLFQSLTSDWLAEVQVTRGGGEKASKKWLRINRRLPKLGNTMTEANSALCRIAGVPINTKSLTEEQLAAMLAADPSSIILAQLLPRVVEYINFWGEFVNEVCKCKPGDTLNVAHLLNAPKVFDDEAA